MRYDQQIFCRWLRARRLVWLCLLCGFGPLATACATTNTQPTSGFAQRLQSVRAGAANKSNSTAIAAAGVPVRRVDVKFAWDAANDSSVVAYRLKWGVASGNYTNVTTASGLTGTLSLQVGVTYYIAATSLDVAGNESKPSNEVTITPQLVYKTYLSGSTDLVTWTDLCEVQTTNAAQMLRLVSRPVNVASQ